jgi:hypothetical protein
MKAWIVTLLFAGPLFGQHAFTPDEIAEGGRLFQSNCTGCHGSAGDQVPGVALMSGKFRRATTDDEVAAVKIALCPVAFHAKRGVIAPARIIGRVTRTASRHAWNR